MATAPEVDVTRISPGDAKTAVDGSARLDAVVIGAGQAGLSAAYHLSRRGLRAHEDFAVLDANEGPGGA